MEEHEPPLMQLNTCFQAPRMFRAFKRRLYAIVTSVLVLALILAWPIGNWVQEREAWLSAGVDLDAIYLVAGAEDQDRRIEAIVSYLDRLDAQSARQTDSGAGYPNQSTSQRVHKSADPAILIGNDTSEGPWHNSANRNLIMAEWAVKKMESADSSLDAARSMEVLPGRFGGTDEEMEALAGHLASRPEIARLGLVTSPFHVRRAIWRLRTRLSSEIQVFAVPAKEKLWIDRAPWMVMGELVKMLRDALGLSRAPFLSRR